MLTRLTPNFWKYNLEHMDYNFCGWDEPQRGLSIEKEIQNRISGNYKRTPDFRGLYYSLYRIQNSKSEQVRNERLTDSQVHVFGILVVGFVLFSIFISLIMFSP